MGQTALPQDQSDQVYSRKVVESKKVIKEYVENQQTEHELLKQDAC